MTNNSTKRALITSVLSLFLCFTMLIGTTFAWFTNTITSSGNIIQTGEFKVGFQWADGKDSITNAQWKDVDGPLFEYTNWEPGHAIMRHFKVSNEGTLALNYKMRIVADGVVSKLADQILVYYFSEDADIVREDLNEASYLGTLSEVLGTDNNLAKTVNGSIEAGASAEIHTLAFKMSIEAGLDYSNTSLGCPFEIQLIATQMSYEEDSFGSDYDEEGNVPNEALPAALVRPIDPEDEIYSTLAPDKIIIGKDLSIKAAGPLGWGYPIANANLDAAYKFLPTEGVSEAEASKYETYHADYVVKADRDVPGLAMALAGYYDAWCSLNDYQWVALASDATIPANEEIRLVKTLGANVNYREICSLGNDGIGFMCGLKALDPEAMAGTTITVELCVYETYPKIHKCDEHPEGHSSENCETGEKIVLSTVTYTFPKSVNSAEGLSEALADGGTITLEPGEYKMPSDQASTADLTIVGTKDTVVDVTLGAYMDKANVTFKGVTIKTSTGMANGNGSDYAALYTPNVTYIDCTFVGPMRVGRDGAKFINCTFTNLGDDYVWTYGNDVTFERCTFNSDGKAILIYSDGGNEVSKVTVKNCVFNSTQGAKAGAIANQNCAAIEIHNYGNGVDLVTEGNTYDANFSGEWRIKTYENGKPQIFVNGTEYTTIALDGKTMTIDADKNVTVQP